MRDEPIRYRPSFSASSSVCWNGRGPAALTFDGRRRVGRELLRSAEPGDGDRGALAVAGLEPDAHPVEAVGGDRDRLAGRVAELLPQLRQPVADRTRASARGRGAPSASAWMRRSATRSPAICRAVLRSSLRLTPFDGRIVICGRRPVSASGATARVGSGRGLPAAAIATRRRCRRPRARRAERDELPPVELDGREQREQRPRGADDRERAEQRRPWPRTRSSCGAIRSAASSPTETA